MNRMVILATVSGVWLVVGALVWGRALARWLRSSRAGEPLQGSPLITCLGGLVVMAGGLAALLLALSGLSAWPTGLILAATALVGAGFAAIDPLVTWLNSAPGPQGREPAEIEVSRPEQEH